MSNVHVQIPKKAFLPCYFHLLETPVDIDFVWGGRDSGKSRHIAMQLIRDCLRLPYFRCLLTRKVYNTILGSQWQLIKDIVTEWKLEKLFTFTEGGCHIECINGNTFEGRGMDDPQRIKSFSNPSHCWIEEGSDATLNDFITIMTSLRYNDGRVKLWYSFNPEVPGDYKKHWLYVHFFDRADCYTNFTSTWTLSKEKLKQAADEQRAVNDMAAIMAEVEVPEESEFPDALAEFLAMRPADQPEKTELPEFSPPNISDNIPVFQQVEVSVDEPISFSYRSTHTTYKDNRYCRPERRAILEGLADLDPFYYEVYTKGHWGNRKVTDPFAYSYDPVKHKKPTVITRTLELILSFDFNRNPITCGVYQHKGHRIRGIESIQLKNSDIYRMCAYILERYPGFIYIVTGDATGQNTTALVKDGINYYTVIKSELKLLDTQIKAPSINPDIKDNRVLLNAALAKLDIQLDPVLCDALHFDLANVSVTDDGKIDKGSRSDPKKRADHMDHFRYYLNTFFRYILKQ